MRLRTLFLVAACAGLFSACSKEADPVGENGNNLKAEAYATLSFVMPNGAASKADTKAVPEDGTPVENNISTVNFLLYDGMGQLQQNISKVRADFTPESASGSVRYTLKEPVEIAVAGTYSVHVVLNPATPLVQANIGTLDAYNSYIETVAKKTGIYCTDNKFMMTNADPVASVTISAENTKSKPALITVNVERLAAKVTFDNTGNVTDILNGQTKIGSVAFDAYKVINTRNSAFKLKRVGISATDFTIGAPEESGKYVIENRFADKATFAQDFYTANYSRKIDTYVAFRKLGTSGVQNIAYALENTQKERQNLEKGLITGVILRGRITLASSAIVGTVGADGTFYKYNGVYYASLEALKTALSFDFKYDENKTNDNETEPEYMARIAADKHFLYNTFRIELFAKGYAYYYYWLRHNNDNNAATIGAMEYAMVRNNVYKLKITSVSNVGDFESGTKGPLDPDQPAKGQEDVEDGGSNPELPGDVAEEQEPNIPVKPVDPKDPIIETDMYLNVEIVVNPWTVRGNNIDL